VSFIEVGLPLVLCGRAAERQQQQQQQQQRGLARPGEDRKKFAPPFSYDRKAYISMFRSYAVSRRGEISAILRRGGGTLLPVLAAAGSNHYARRLSDGPAGCRSDTPP